MALMFALILGGCGRRQTWTARVQLPAVATAQTQLVVFARSEEFAARVRARAASAAPGEFTVVVRQARNTSLLEVGAAAKDGRVAAEAAKLMPVVLKEYATERGLGPIQLLEEAGPRGR